MKKVRLEATAPLSGYVMLNVLDPIESVKLGKELQLQLNDKGEMVPRSDEDKLIFIYEVAEKHCLEVNVKTENGLEIKDVKELGYDEDGRKFLQEIGVRVFKSIKLSPKSLVL